MRLLIHLWLAPLLMGLGCAGPAPPPITLEDVGTPVQWGSAERVVPLRHLWFSGQPDEAGLQAARDAGVTFVLDLRVTDEREWDEAAAAQRVGLRYENFAIPKEGPLPEATLQAIETFVAANPGVPMLVHCSSGNRAAAWLTTHLVRKHELAYADALAIGRQAGLTSEALEAKVAAHLGEPGD